MWLDSTVSEISALFSLVVMRLTSSHDKRGDCQRTMLLGEAIEEAYLAASMHA